jgi:hypothetical protein
VPMSVGHLPLYWLMINTTGPVFCAALLFSAPGYFSGWRRLLIVFVPVAADAGCSIVVGLPVYSVLHAPGSSDLLHWVGASISMVAGLAILDGEAKWILSRTRSLADARVAIDAELPPVS